MFRGGGTVKNILSFKNGFSTSKWWLGKILMKPNNNQTAIYICETFNLVPFSNFLKERGTSMENVTKDQRGLRGTTPTAVTWHFQFWKFICNGGTKKTYQHIFGELIYEVANTCRQSHRHTVGIKEVKLLIVKRRYCLNYEMKCRDDMSMCI